MPAEPSSRSVRQGTALVVLAISLAATSFAVWREQELVRREQVIRFQDGFTQVSPPLEAMISQRFYYLLDLAKDRLRRAGYSAAGWDGFLKESHWQARFPGMKEIGYADYTGDKCVVKFSASRFLPPVHPPGFDLDSDASLRDTVRLSGEDGYGIASDIMTLGAGTNASQVIVGLLPVPIVDKRAARSPENLANLHGFIFFALNQPEYFRYCEPRLKSLPFAYHLLAPDELTPTNTPTLRQISTRSPSGRWRFYVTMKPPGAAQQLPQWVVGIVGVTLSGLLYYLLYSQARLRFAGELAGEKIQQCEAAERKLSDALEREKELHRLKSNFVSMVTHEIRTPLAHILGSTDILSRYLDRLSPEKRAQHFAHITSAVQRMSALMEDVLLFSKAEAGRMEFNPVSLDLKSFCVRLADEVQSATGRRYPFELNLEEIPVSARADELLLRHIFLNLLGNAVKYSPPGAPVRFSVSRDHGNAIFLVQDAGMGIPEDDRKQLFTPFHRGKNVAALPGTGLGLIIVKHCVEQHGGNVAIESRENAGTQVTVRLPLFSPDHTEFVHRLSRKITADEN